MAMDWLVTDPALKHLKRSAIMEDIRRDEGPPQGRQGYVTAEDLEHTRHRIKTGLPMAPLSVWRW
jgi:hypothetical protein